MVLILRFLQIGIAIAAVGNQIVTTVLTTYAVDSQLELSSNIGSFINMVRQTWAFIGMLFYSASNSSFPYTLRSVLTCVSLPGPFYFPDMLEALTVAGACGLMGGLIVLCAAGPVAVLQYSRERKYKTAPSFEPASEDQGVALPR